MDPVRYIEHTTVDISAIDEAGLVKLGMCFALDHLIRTLNYKIPNDLAWHRRSFLLIISQ
jgi:hypothetical protein